MGNHKSKDRHHSHHSDSHNNQNNQNNVPPNNNRQPEAPPKFSAIRDKYETYEQLQDALRASGLESSNLIIGVDYTISNTTAGKKTFWGKSLHTCEEGLLNPYMQVISIMGKTLEIFDDDKLIPAFGFGDARTSDNSVFPFYADKVAYGFQEVLQRYKEITPTVKLQGPTSFAPLIREAIKIVKAQRAYHILVIIADGEVTPDNDFTTPTAATRAAIVEASEYPLSIIMVGVGDGPWDMMNEFDDGLPERKFDNFQFVNFFEVMKGNQVSTEAQEVGFAMAAMQEVPEQYHAIRKHGLLEKV